jgi:hypothetical protein
MYQGSAVSTPVGGLKKKVLGCHFQWFWYNNSIKSKTESETK